MIGSLERNSTRERVGPGPIARAAARVARWWARRTTIEALMALDDRTLRDIGVRRMEIPAVVDRVLGGARSGS